MNCKLIKQVDIKAMKKRKRIRISNHSKLTYTHNKIVMHLITDVFRQIWYIIIAEYKVSRRY